MCVGFVSLDLLLGHPERVGELALRPALATRALTSGVEDVEVDIRQIPASVEVARSSLAVTKLPSNHACRQPPPRVVGANVSIGAVERGPTWMAVSGR